MPLSRRRQVALRRLSTDDKLSAELEGKYIDPAFISPPPLLLLSLLSESFINRSDAGRLPWKLGTHTVSRLHLQAGGRSG